METTQEKIMFYEEYQTGKIRELKYKSVIFFIFSIFFYLSSFVTNIHGILAIAGVLSVIYIFYFKNYLIQRIFVAMQKCKIENDEEILLKLENCMSIIENNGTFYDAQNLYKSAKEYYIENYYNFSFGVSCFASSELNKIRAKIKNLQ